MSPFIYLNYHEIRSGLYIWNIGTKTISNKIYSTIILFPVYLSICTLQRTSFQCIIVPYCVFNAYSFDAL